MGISLILLKALASRDILSPIGLRMVSYCSIQNLWGLLRSQSSWF
ncbi:hypothetical protein CKA32_000268 [Geitlerinema sp. FC II]|nr:hypothetical protein CKA32_000354 [Geitlerinema sp. FC II]PPT05636.1 hypothetical protein CKA32_002289 [Geitlerinema sp. FC II]PPT05959.1 hypothetical protein CKA32_003825 [Geitlerinema sp. FC II]PPT06012.1 hypothetical protein CKA32_005481 [Geitlerinema sp. FC II]PPT06321.1 hypothetical protein CKA32_002508 [Geitlerinema sp. FC II]